MSDDPLDKFVSARSRTLVRHGSKEAAGFKAWFDTKGRRWSEVPQQFAALPDTQFGAIISTVNRAAIRDGVLTQLLNATAKLRPGPTSQDTAPTL